jgi:GDP-D-mannose 3', 5'-epimerase
MEKTGKVLVTGAGGFFGGHLVADLVRGGHSEIRAIDCKLIAEWYQVSLEAETICADLMRVAACRAATRGTRRRPGAPDLPPLPSGMGHFAEGRR